jgi:hypothetical protein
MPCQIEDLKKVYIDGFVPISKSELDT